ncbi:oligosaccharide flippase family protein [Legionella nagasakiensis]|uniref:oligosaccharide flippase family protein n=1 Tax=Legionella nagasakiensis TaxID=535290 RepID=UPI001055D5A3|nr:oligosaccharide flippase family protein [Legionella nagasakiensis]
MKSFLENETVRSLLTVTIASLNYFIMMLINIMLARFLGAQVFGDYAIAIVIANVGYIIAVLGKGQIALKNVPIYLKNNKYQKIRHFIQINFFRIIIFSLLLSMFFISSYFLILHLSVQDVLHPVLYAGLLIPIMAVVYYMSCILLSMQYIVSTLLVLQILIPVQYLAIILLFQIYDNLFTEHHALLAVLISWLIGSLIYSYVLRKYLFYRANKKLLINQVDSLTSGFSFLFVQVILGALQSVGVIVIELLEKDESIVGIYAMADQLSFFVILLYNTTLTYILPKLSVLLDNDEHRQTQAFLNKVFCRFFILCIFMSFIYVFLGEHILKLCGERFTAAYLPLLIISLGNMVNMLLGVSYYVIQYKESNAAVIKMYAVLFALNVMLTLFLVPYLSAMGAALGITIPLLLIFLYQVAYIRTKYGLSIIRIRA